MIWSHSNLLIYLVSQMDKLGFLKTFSDNLNIILFIDKRLLLFYLLYLLYNV